VWPAGVLPPACGSAGGGRCGAGGALNKDWAAPDTGAHWLLHFAVDPRTGTDAAVERVLTLGGQVDFDPYDSELGRIARVTDPSGAAFALIDPTRRLESATDLPPGSARVDDPYDD
jgi:predicted enzyme related to lactoylglutathione lyase